MPKPLPMQDESRVRGQDTADLFHFFKQAQDSSTAMAGQARHMQAPWYPGLGKAMQAGLTRSLCYSGNTQVFSGWGICSLAAESMRDQSCFC
jgi:hypothetical protein